MTLADQITKDRTSLGRLSRRARQRLEHAFQAAISKPQEDRKGEMF